MSSSGSVVLEKKNLIDPNPYLHFCDYLPLEKNLALPFNNISFFSLKDDLYQV
jgi:hypothetical protein